MTNGNKNGSHNTEMEEYPRSPSTSAVPGGPSGSFKANENQAQAIQKIEESLKFDLPSSASPSLSSYSTGTVSSNPFVYSKCLLELLICCP